MKSRWNLQKRKLNTVILWMKLGSTTVFCAILLLIDLKVPIMPLSWLTDWWGGKWRLHVLFRGAYICSNFGSTPCMLNTNTIAFLALLNLANIECTNFRRGLYFKFHNYVEWKVYDLGCFTWYSVGLFAFKTQLHVCGTCTIMYTCHRCKWLRTTMAPTVLSECNK